jgi:transcriptional regulator with XRE-family HTH domain
MATFGEKLKAARLNKGLKQSEVAEKLDCAPTSLTNWENDKVQPSLDVLSKLCEVYEISPLSLLESRFEYSDIVAIARKPVPERTYEEQIALNFSEPILDRLLAGELQRRETARIEETAAFLRKYDLLTRFGGSMNKAQIEAVRAEYDNDGADTDVLFAFHLLTAGGKSAFLSMLSGLLSDMDNLQAFTDKMDKAQVNIIERLAAQRAEIKKG